MGLLMINSAHSFSMSYVVWGKEMKNFRKSFHPERNMDKLCFLGLFNL